jgi:hypothetical protein
VAKSIKSAAADEYGSIANRNEVDADIEKNAAGKKSNDGAFRVAECFGLAAGALGKVKFRLQAEII